MLRSRILVLACLSTLTLAGCSDSTDATPGSGNTKAASTPATATQASGGLTAAALCDYLRGETPKLQSVGSKVGAEAQLAIGLADFFDKNGKPADGAQMDDLTTKECPDVRADVLKAIGKNGFNEL